MFEVIGLRSLACVLGDGTIRTYIAIPLYAKYKHVQWTFKRTELRSGWVRVEPISHMQYDGPKVILYLIKSSKYNASFKFTRQIIYSI